MARVLSIVGAPFEQATNPFAFLAETTVVLEQLSYLIAHDLCKKPPGPAHGFPKL
jgi:hypothetical protein